MFDAGRRLRAFRRRPGHRLCQLYLCYRSVMAGQCARPNDRNVSETVSSKAASDRPQPLHCCRSIRQAERRQWDTLPSLPRMVEG
jgi:hypothetical protein